MLPQFDGDTADEIWRAAAKALTEDWKEKSQDSRLGPTRELLHASFHLRDPRQRWVLSRKPAINPAFGIAEVVWILRGRDDAAFLNFWNPALPKFAGATERYYGAYGKRLRNALGLNQIDGAYKALVANPDSRQVVLQIWSSRRDFPKPDGTSRSPDIPCNVVAMPKIRHDRLEWLQVMRSNDLYLGTPHNFVQFTTLQEVMAGWLDLELGSYVQISDSLHLYEHNLAEFAIGGVSQVRNEDDLALPKRESEKALKEIERAMDDIRSPDLTCAQLVKRVDGANLPAGWLNCLRIVAADAARRKGWAAEAEAIAGGCTNPALMAAWAGWNNRQTASAPRPREIFDC